MLEVGQKLYKYATDKRHGKNDPVEVTVQKVGRKWAIIDHGRRVDMDTLYVDCAPYTSDARCYRSVEERENEVALQRAWGDLRQSVDRQWSSPTSNIEAIYQAASLLGFALPGAKS